MWTREQLAVLAGERCGLRVSEVAFFTAKRPRDLYHDVKWIDPCACELLGPGIRMVKGGQGHEEA